jgi:hypothetical protein
MVNYEQVMTTEEGVWEWLKRIASLHAIATVVDAEGLIPDPLYRISMASVSCRVSQARPKRPRP